MPLSPDSTALTPALPEKHRDDIPKSIVNSHPRTRPGCSSQAVFPLYLIGSNFSPYTSSPYCTRTGSQLGFIFIPIFNWSTESALICPMALTLFSNSATPMIR